ncbi:type II CRISPR RNA-guided endonuclease Cas9, partial [Flavobacteriaceae bacterium (ex Bugula neritina AB1)]
EISVEGKNKIKRIGPKVTPKSSPVFQEAKVWQDINKLILTNEETKEELQLDEELKTLLFEELNWREGFSKTELLRFIKKNTHVDGKRWGSKLEKLEGNRTWGTLLKVYDHILQIEGYQPIDYKKDMRTILEQVKVCFKEIGINTRIMEMDYSIKGNDFPKQPAYHLWHLLYSYEDDNSPTGIEGLQQKLQDSFGFTPEHTQLLAQVTFQENYGNLSVRALRKLMPFLQEGKIYSDACALAGYRHSKSLTAEENKNRELVPKLALLKKNALRNPVVEKILNQMINMVNTIIEDPNLGRPDEIRIELARELKKTAKQRAEMTSAITKATSLHQKYRETIKKDFGLSYVSRKDLIKYKLYLELKPNGFETLYSGTYIKPEELFTNKFDVEHIIPQSVLFDDSFSNKTLELRGVNLEKGNQTAIDYCIRKGWENDFKARVEQCYNQGKGDLKYGKRAKLLMSVSEIPKDFLNRDLGNTAYIAKEAKKILLQAVRNVYPTTGGITERLRSDWELVNVLQELNWEKYKAQGLTYYDYNKEGKALPRIQDWTKRNDHRHHAMDAIAVAFTKPAYIQYLNNLHAKSDKGSSIYSIEKKYIYRDEKGKKKFKKPTPDLREQVKQHLSQILVSHKAKNKAVTKNKNKIKIKGKNNFKTKTELAPRGQLHKETIYGKSLALQVKEEKLNASFTLEKAQIVQKKAYREALLKRLKAFDNDPKKAFSGKNSPAKNPIYTTENKQLPEKIKTQQFIHQFTIRKEVTPDLKIDKVVDERIKNILKARLEAFENKPKKAFVNLDKNPIWLNQKQGIAIKRVTITGVSNAEPLHKAKDHNGHNIKDENDRAIPNDYVSPGNNHHIAVYQNEEGDLDDQAVSFYEAVIRKNQGLPIVNQSNEKGWPLLFTLKQNEMFVFPSEGFNPKEIDLLDASNKSLIADHLFRVQKLSKVSYNNSSIRDYVFRHHLETKLNNHKNLKGITYHNIKSIGYLKDIVKVRLNHLGEIVQIGEY